MKSRFLRLVAVAMLALPFLIASCSKKDKGTGPNPDAAPTLITPSFAQAVNFVGSNAGLLSAKAKVQAELALVAPFLATPAAFATAANAGTWSAKVDSCWSKSSASGACTTAFDVCEVDSITFEWMKTLDGTCSGTAQTQFVSIDATIKNDGTSGSFSLFKSATTTLDTLWKWVTPSDTSKDFNVYKGAESPANLIANLHWKKGTGASASNWTFTTTGTPTLTAGVTTSDPGKWELHISTDGKTGTMDVYQVKVTASPAVYYVSDHIAWNPDSTGTWQVYNADGELTNETKWPIVPAPTLIVPSFSQAVEFAGSSSSTLSAKAKVQDEIAMVGPFLATPSAFATAANTGAWGNQLGLCWPKTSTQGSCTTAYEVCDVGSASYEWTKTLDGTCSGTAHTQFKAVDATIAGNGSTGTFGLYKDNTTDLDTTWKWTTALDNNSRDWNVYNGAVSTANLIASLHWSKGTGSSANNWTFEKTGTSSALSAGVSTTDPAKWELHVSTDTKTGSMDIYQWQAGAGAAAYYRSEHIAWNPDSTGTWQSFDDQGNVTNETNWPVTVPDVVIPDLGHDVVINSTDQCAQIAKLMAQSQVSIAHAFASLGSSFLYVLDSIHLGDQVDGCWSWSTPYLGCSATYELCEESGGFHWSLTYDGTCGSVPYDHWVAFEGMVGNDGRSGSWIAYEDGTTTPFETLTWSTSADGKAGTFDLYSGEVLEANHEEQITWSTALDGSTDLTIEYLGSSPSKWETHVSADGTSGYSRSYSWDDTPPAHYWLQSEIIWNSDGTGEQNSYQEDGTVTPECSW